MSKVFRDIREPIREDRSFQNLWRQDDKGLIASWEVGREKRIKYPELAEKALNGELPMSGYKGGVEKETKKKTKIGSLRYLAEWQGLRSENLNIDFDCEIKVTCSKTGVTVLFTSDISKLKNE